MRPPQRDKIGAAGGESSLSSRPVIRPATRAAAASGNSSELK